MKIAILGGGTIGEIHRRSALAAGASVVAAMASTPARSEELALRWGTQALRSLGDLYSVRPDVVHICSPNAEHYAQVVAAIGCGAHVICEKPLATSLSQAQELTDLARTSGKIATVPFVYRFHPLIRELRDRVAAGEFGKWQFMHGSYLQDWLLSPQASNWRVDSAEGGESRVFADIGSHWCDLMEFVSGETIHSLVAAMATTVESRPSQSDAGSASVNGRVQTEDVCAVLFKTVSGVIGSVGVSQVAAGRKNRLWFELDGANKSAVFDQENPETLWLGQQGMSTTLYRDPSVGSKDQRRLSVLPAGHPQGYSECFDRFIEDSYEAINGNFRTGLPVFADGLRASTIVDAVIRSSRNGTWVTL